MHVAKVCVGVSRSPEPQGHESRPHSVRLAKPNGRAARATSRAVLHISGGTALWYTRLTARLMASGRLAGGPSLNLRWLREVKCDRLSYEYCNTAYVG